MKKSVVNYLALFAWIFIAGACSQAPKKTDSGVAAITAEPVTAEGRAPASVNPTDGTAEYHFSLAQAYVTEGNPDRAIEEYKLTLMYDPNSSLVYARLAGEYVKKGMITAAMDTCKEALARDPQFSDARLMLAGLYSASREQELALKEYEFILKKNPRHEEATVYKAQIQSELGKTKEATATLRGFLKGAKGDNESPLVWYYLGRTEQQQNHFKEAVTAYQKAIELRPGFSQASLALGFLYEEKQMNAKAMETYSALYEDSQDPAAANRLATMYLKEEKFLKAVPYLQAMEASDPEDLNVRVKLGLVQMELKQYEPAIATFKYILTKNPDSDRIHYYLGSLYEETKQFEQATAELKQVGPDSKLFSDSALHVGYLLKQANKVDDAKAFIRGAIAKAPRTPNFYIFNANLEEEGKNLKAAVGILEGAVALFPENEKVRYYLGSLYDRQGDTDKGVEQMEAILAVNPKNVDALNYIGYTWTQKGVRMSDAETMIRKALLLKPDNGYIQDSWGWHLFVRGRLPEAVIELEKAARLKPNEPTILEHLADAYLRSNLREKALSRYQDAAKYSEDSDTRLKMERKVQNLQTELAESHKPSVIGADGRAPASMPDPE